MMNWLMDNWYLLVSLVALLFSIASLVLGFSQKPTSEQLLALSEWLKYAVVEAEKALGTGTGQLKLRFVWNMAIERFDWIEKVVPFERFSYYVDLALVWMRRQLERNTNISTYVEGGKCDDTGTEELHTDDR